MTNPPLPEEIVKDIDNYMSENHPFVWPKNKHGEDMVQPVGHVNPPFWRKHQHQIAPIRSAAEHYASLWQDAERRLRESSELLIPILDWGQQGNVGLGQSITQEALRRAKAFTTLRDALERIVQVYDLHSGFPSDDMAAIAREALAQFPEGGKEGGL